MPLRILPLLLSLCLTACSSFEGYYEPSCAAYEGDTIELNDGKFVWKKFTDVRSIGPDGKPVEPYPSFPRTGHYIRSAERIELHPDDGTSPKTYYLLQVDAASYLLSLSEWQSYQRTARVPDCALGRRISEE